MNQAKAFNYGIMLGAAVMYFLDPRRGGERRARIRDKSLKAIHDVEDAAVIGSRDAAHRLRGVVARVRSDGHHTDSDEVIVDRVRSVLGRACSHPHAIQVIAKGNGCIELKGPILKSDVKHVLSLVSRVRGVEDIDNDLEVHDAPGEVPALQGTPVRRPIGLRLVPAAKLGLGAAAAGLAIASLLAGHPLGFVFGGAGTLAMARSIKSRGTPIFGRRARGRSQRPELDKPQVQEELAFEQGERATTPIYPAP